MVEIKKKVSKGKVEETKVIRSSFKKDDEPDWYHYLIVVLFFAAVIAGIYYGISYYDKTQREAAALNNSNGSSLILYNYPYKVGNVTYNIKFHSPVDEIVDMDYVVEPTKIDVLNTRNFRMVFLEYNGTDNGEVAKGSTMVLSFLKNVYRYKFDNESFAMIGDVNCSDSTVNEKVIVFDPYRNETGVFIDDNGCIEFVSNDSKVMIDLADKFVYNIINTN